MSGIKLGSGWTYIIVPPEVLSLNLKHFSKFGAWEGRKEGSKKIKTWFSFVVGAKAF